MKLRINTKIIKKLRPCRNRLDNYLKYYENFDYDVTEFFKLSNITYDDKLWVVLRLIPNEMKVVFALDCSFSAYAAAYAAYAAADAADAAAAAAYAAADAADAAAAYAAEEQQNQLEVLLYLIRGEK